MVVLRAGALGDVVLLRPALASLRSAGFEVVLFAPSGPAALLTHEIDAVWPWESPDVARFLGEAGHDRSETCARLATASAVLAITRDASVLEALRRCAGKVIALDPTPPPGQHAAAWYEAATRELGTRSDSRPTVLEMSRKARERAERLALALPRDFLVLHPGSGSRRKNWSAESFGALAGILAPATAFAVVEGPADVECVARLLKYVPRAVIIRNEPLDALGAFVARAGVYVGNDSGVTHLAAAVGTAVVALFGPTDPAVWSPLGRSVRVLRAPDHDLQRLDPARVAEAAVGLRSEVRALRGD